MKIIQEHVCPPPPLVLLLLLLSVCLWVVVGKNSARSWTFLLLLFPTITRCRERKKFLFNGLVLSLEGLCPREMRWIINREDGKSIPLLSDGCWDGMLQLISCLRQFSELIPPFLFLARIY
jgi:hypothetical protein